VEYIVRSGYGALFQDCLLLDKPTTLLENSTLNQKFNIQANVSIAEDEKRAMKYVTVGNGGHRMETGANGISLPKSQIHRARDAALFNHIPFVLRRPDQDLSVTERAKYRLRRIEVHDGSPYVAYYARLLDTSQTVPTLELRTVTNGVTTSTPFIPQLSDLSPTPVPVTPGQVLTTDGTYLAATAKVPFTMSLSDINEFLNSCRIIYGDDNYAIVSEIALCSGADRAVTGDFNGVSLGYTEAIGCQIATFISTFFALKFTNSDLQMLLDVGSSEPLLTV
jgi:hypothetical protein